MLRIIRWSSLIISCADHWIDTSTCSSHWCSGFRKTRGCTRQNRRWTRRGAGAMPKSDRQSSAEAETRGFGAAANANVRRSSLRRDNADAGVHISRAPIIDEDPAFRARDNETSVAWRTMLWERCFFSAAQCIVDKTGAPKPTTRKERERERRNCSWMLRIEVSTVRFVYVVSRRVGV